MCHKLTSDKNLFFGRNDGDDISTEEDEDARNGFVPGEDVLSEDDGNHGGNDGLEVGVDGDGRGLQVLHREGDEEIAEGRSAQYDEGHLECAIPTPGCCIEGILGEFWQGDGNGDNG